MTVYIDDMYLNPMGNFGRLKMSHMIADTEDELHKMAAAIGVARKWYQGDHYDVCKSMRTKAVKLGAVELSMFDLGRKVIAMRRAAAGLVPPDGDNPSSPG